MINSTTGAHPSSDANAQWPANAALWRGRRVHGDVDDAGTPPGHGDGCTDGTKTANKSRDNGHGGAFTKLQLLIEGETVAGTAMQDREAIGATAERRST